MFASKPNTVKWDGPQPPSWIYPKWGNERDLEDVYLDK